MLPHYVDATEYQSQEEHKSEYVWRRWGKGAGRPIAGQFKAQGRILIEVIS